MAWRWRRLALLLAGLLMVTQVATGCSGEATRAPSASATTLAPNRTGSFTFRPECCHKLTVHHATGDGDLADAQIFVVMHG